MLKVLDTFAGAGGFSLGFELAGYNIVGALETDQWASDTFAHNHPKARVVVGDITNLKKDFLNEAFSRANKPDVILGGPPCQGYSICNKNAGDPKDPRNTLFSEFLRMADIYRPTLMVMENVPNLIKAYTSSKRLVIDVIVEELKSRNYYVYYDILHAVQYGIPQIRQRLFVIASKFKIATPFPLATHAEISDTPSLLSSHLNKCPSLWEAISDLPDIEACEGAEEMPYDKEPSNDYQELLRKRSRTVFNHKSMNHTKRMVERFASMKWGESVSDVPQHLKPYKRNGNGVISGNAYDQNNRRMHPDRPCHTIPASFYANFVHPYKNRNFTAREGARIQSFPDWYVFKGKPTVVSQKLLAREERHHERFLCQYNQIGNAVPPILAQAIAANILKQWR